MTTITKEAHNTYQWYIDSMGWLNTSLTPENRAKLAQAQEQMLEVLNSVEVEG